MSTPRRMDLCELESFCPSPQKIFNQNGKNLLSRDLASYGYSPWLIILCYVIIAICGNFLSIPVVLSCHNHPPQKEFFWPSCRASYGAVYSFSRAIFFEHLPKSTPIFWSSCAFCFRRPSCSHTPNTNASRSSQNHGDSSST